MSTVSLGGTPVAVRGRFLKKGDAAPAFSLVGKDLQRRPRCLRGQAQDPEHFPERRHAHCAMSVRQFNARASILATRPYCAFRRPAFAQARFCGAEA